MASYKAEAMKDLPKEFQEFIESNAYERGHAYGEAEVDAIAGNLANDFRPCLERYLAYLNKGIFSQTKLDTK